jgi:hypothetical protein
MNDKAFNVIISVRDNNAAVIRGVVQHDNGNLFNLKIFDGNEPFDFTGYTNMVLTILKPDGTRVVDSDTGASLDFVNPEKGTVQISVGGQATVLTGMHFCSLEIFADGKRVTTARFNYFVSESLDAVNVPSEIQSKDEWPVLQGLVASCSEIISAERQRVLSELERIAAEDQRISTTEGIVAQVTALAQMAQSHAEQAQQWAQMAQLVALGEPLPVVTKEELKQRLKEIDCGSFTEEIDHIEIKRGAEADLPLLATAELAYCMDTERLYIGTPTGNPVLINGPAFVASAVAPSDKSLLWIDISSSGGKAIKYHDGSSWVGTATATFG